VSHGIVRVFALRDMTELDLQKGDMITWDPADSSCPIIITRVAHFTAEDIVHAIDRGALSAVELRRASSFSPPLAQRAIPDVATDEATPPRLQLLRSHLSAASSLLICLQGVL
jgi:hypothetical protein